MRTSSIDFALLGLLGLFSAAANATVATPSLVHILTGTIVLGAPLAPIPVPGGVQIVEPFASGNFTGAFNGTIKGGTATPSWDYNQTVSFPSVEVYGTTTDGESFFVQANGIGTPADQLASVKVSIGGKYLYLTKEFVLASLSASADHKSVTVEAWVVQQGSLVGVGNATVGTTPSALTSDSTASATATSSTTPFTGASPSITPTFSSGVFYLLFAASSAAILLV